MTRDLVLSSGFLAFAEHAGFLRAVEECGVGVGGLCGTSSGALAGLLWAAGLPAREVFGRLTARVPLARVRPSRTPWRGLLDLGPLRAELAATLPARLEDFPIPVGVGTVGPEGAHRLVTRGPAVDAVLASCAVPWLFAPILLDGRPHADGGARDRTALTAWRRHRPAARVILHLLDRTAGAPTEPDLADLTVVRSPRSGARLWNLGEVEQRYARARDAARAVLRP